jgi:hypothetical protein
LFLALFFHQILIFFNISLIFQAHTDNKETPFFKDSPMFQCLSCSAIYEMLPPNGRCLQKKSFFTKCNQAVVAVGGSALGSRPRPSSALLPPPSSASAAHTRENPVEQFLYDINAMPEGLEPLYLSHHLPGGANEFMISQHWLMDIFKSLGYLINTAGMCVGLTLACIRFSLNGQLATFFQLLNFIYTTWYGEGTFFLAASPAAAGGATALNKKMSLIQKNIVGIGKEYCSTGTERPGTSTLLELEMAACLKLGLLIPEYRQYRRFLNAVQLVSEVSVAQRPEAYRELQGPSPVISQDIVRFLNLGGALDYMGSEAVVFAGNQGSLIVFLNTLKQNLDRRFEKINIVQLAFYLVFPEHVVALIYLKEKESRFQLVDPSCLYESQLEENNKTVANRIFQVEEQQEIVFGIQCIISCKQARGWGEMSGKVFPADNLMPFLNSITSLVSTYTNPFISSVRDQKVLNRIVCSASAVGDLKILNKLKTAKALPPILAFPPPPGNSPLLLAAWFGHVDVVQFWIAQGQGEKEIQIALFAAVHSGHLKLVDFLLTQLGIDLNGGDENGNTPLHLAVICKNSAMVDNLIKAGAQQGKPNKWGMTPKEHALDKPEIFRLFR